MTRRALVSLCLFLFAALVQAAEPETLRVGLPRTLVGDVPEAFFNLTRPPFRALLRAQVGQPGELEVAADADELARQLSEGKVRLAIFQGFEYARARQQFPRFAELAIAVREHRHHELRVMVHAGEPAADLAGLTGRKVLLPARAREHFRLFFDRRCRDCGKGGTDFEVVETSDLEGAFDDLADGSAAAVVADSVALECYQRRKPGRFNRMRPLGEPEVFPASVVAYVEGSIPAEQLRTLERGLTTAHQSLAGKNLLMLWKLKAFEAVPADDRQLLDAVLKSYPAASPPPLAQGR